MALGAIGPAAAPATEMLIKSINSKDAGERESALYALRKIGPGAKAAVKPLLERIEDRRLFRFRRRRLGTGSHRPGRRASRRSDHAKADENAEVRPTNKSGWKTSKP